MSRLNLHCELCGRRQANGLLSGAAWGRVAIAPDVTLCACPSCKSTNPDWEGMLRSTTAAFRPGVTGRAAS